MNGPNDDESTPKPNEDAEVLTGSNNPNDEGANEPAVPDAEPLAASEPNKPSSRFPDVVEEKFSLEGK